MPSSLLAVEATEAVNVRVLGAVGDGVADDTAVIQAALRSSASRIYIPSGIYRITSILRIPSNKRLTLAPTAIMLRGSKANAMLLNEADGTTGGYGAAANIIVEGGTWNGNGPAFPDPCTLIAFGHASDIVIRDCTIVSIPVWHGIELNSTRRATIERVSLMYASNEAIQLDTMLSLESGVFPWFGPYDNAKCRDIVIQDCRFTQVWTAVGSHAAPPVDGLVIRRCVMDTIGDIAVKPVLYANWSVEDCEFINCKTVLAGSSTGLTFRDNRILNSGQADLVLANFADTMIEGNTISNSKGAFASAGATVTLRNNKVDVPWVQAAPALLSAASSDTLYYTTTGRTRAATRLGVNYTLVGSATVTTALIVGDRTTLAVSPAGSGTFTYQWNKDGVAIAGATESRYLLAEVALDATGLYTATVTNAAGSVTSAPARVTVSNNVALTNISIRGALNSSTALLSVGYGLTGPENDRLLIRAIGPSLAVFGVMPAEQDPRLEVYDDRGEKLAENINWEASLASTFEAVGAFALPIGSKDAAVLVSAPPGTGTARVRGSGTGVTLVEVFNLSDPRSSRMTNVSARGTVGSGDGVIVAGFVLSGTETKRLLIRGIGPRLSGFGVLDPLDDPRLELYNSSGFKIAANDDWTPDLAPVFASVGTFALEPGSKDAALLVTLQGGTSYTAVLRGDGVSTGDALLEVYELL